MLKSYYGCVLTLLACFCANPLALAAEKPTPKGNNKSQEKTTTKNNLSSNRRIEAILSQPAQLKDMKRVTFQELLQALQKQHKLTVRLDSAYAMLFAISHEELFAGRDEPLKDVIARLQSVTNSQTIASTTSPATVTYQPYYTPGSPQVGYAPPQASSTLVTPTYTDGTAVAPTPHATLIANKPPQAEVENAKEAKARKRNAKVKEQAASEEKPANVKPKGEPKEEPVEENIEDDPIQIVTRITDEFMKGEVSFEGVDTEEATVENVLRHALSQLTSALEITMFGETGLPVAFTHAFDVDLLITDGAVEITTKLNANLHKETRVYRISHFKDLDGEELSQVITRTIRPWSWRSQINELIGQIEADWIGSFQIPKVNLDLTGNGMPVQIQSSDEDAAPEQVAATTQQNQEVSLEALNAMGNLLSTGTIAFVHSMISGTEMLHYAEPPTGVIEVLPGMLIVTQSQSTHREIADLLSQMEEAVASD